VIENLLYSTPQRPACLYSDNFINNIQLDRRAGSAGNRIAFAPLPAIAGAVAYANVSRSASASLMYAVAPTSR
jgi:hypothetical protein